MERSMLILIAGGTASGKSTVVKEIETKIGESVISLCTDDFVNREGIQLIPNSSFEDQFNSHFNFNDPDRIEKGRLLGNLEAFLRGEEVEIRLRQKILNKPSI